MAGAILSKQNFSDLVALARTGDRAGFENRLKALNSPPQALMLVNQIEIETGNALLHYAAQLDNQNSVILLLKSGADLAQENNAGKVARDLVPAGSFELASFFREQHCLANIKLQLTHGDFIRVSETDLAQIAEFAGGLTTEFIPDRQNIIDLVFSQLARYPEHLVAANNLLKRILALKPMLFREQPAYGKKLVIAANQAGWQAIVDTLIRAGANFYYREAAAAAVPAPVLVSSVPTPQILDTWARRLVNMHEFIYKVVITSPTIRQAHLDEYGADAIVNTAGLRDTVAALYLNLRIKLKSAYVSCFRNMIRILSDETHSPESKIAALLALPQFPELVSYLIEYNDKAQTQSNYTLQECFEIYQSLTKTQPAAGGRRRSAERCAGIWRGSFRR